MAGIIHRSYYDAGQKGIQDAQNTQYNRLRNQDAEQVIEHRNMLNQQTLAQDKAAQVKQFATDVVNATQYVSKVPAGQRKAFIEKNFPFLAQTYGPEWATANEEQITSELGGIAAKFGVQAGVGPAEPKGASALYKYLGPDGKPVYGDAVAAAGNTPYDAPPQVTPQFTPVQTADGVGSFDSRTGKVVQTGAAAPPPKPPPQTEGDKKVATQFSSMLSAETQLAGLTGDDTSSVYNAAVGSNPVTRLMQTESFRKNEAAGLRWAANLLYIKSGATATPDEIRSTWKQYFPQPGDSDAVKEQKYAARQEEMSGIAGVYNLDASKIPKRAAKQAPAPPAALQYLQQHPEAAPQFKAKYGYLP